MNTTTNYNLKKYQSGDLFNPLTVNNSNLDDIDTDMKAISDRAIGRATELVSQGVHAITLLDTDCKTFKFVATGNYSAGETFTVNGIQANAYTPSGSALVSNAFVTGSIVLGALNEDGTAITFYVTGSALADDSLKLGGELPSYYATQSEMTDAKTDITNLKNQNGNTSIAGIGDGTLSGAVSSLNNDKVERMANVSGYQTVDVLGYNPTTKKLGLKVNGADTVIPFNSGISNTFLYSLINNKGGNTDVDIFIPQDVSSITINYTTKSSYVSTGVYVDGTFHDVTSSPITYPVSTKITLHISDQFNNNSATFKVIFNT